MTDSTIAGNLETGLRCRSDSSPELTRCIVWSNLGGSISVEDESTVRVDHSCLEEDIGVIAELGEGNINDDPQFCGWGAGGEVHVDGDLASALTDYSLAPAAGSPCREPGGAQLMGAYAGTCDEPGSPEQLVRLSPGTYDAGPVNLVHHVSLQGSGDEETVVRGFLQGIRSGAILSDLTLEGEIRVTRGQAPEIVRCAIVDGGGVECFGASPTLRDCTIARNNGSGVECAEGSSVTLINCTLEQNQGGYSGGGLRCSNSSATLTGCRLRGNVAPTLGGGGLRCVGSTVTLTACTIVGNAAKMGGGGISCRNNNLLSLTNCIIAGNHAGTTGGGAMNLRGSSASLWNCTVTGNSAESLTGGVHCNMDSSARLTNCIVWGNLPDNRCGSLSHTLTTEDPLFETPGVFDSSLWDKVEIGGNEWLDMPDFVVEPPDCHLQAGSPAIDAGTPVGAPPDDIEGNPRPCGGRVDIGAYEFGGCDGPTLFRRGDCNDDGSVDISDAICVLNWLFAGGEEPGCVAVANTNGDADADLSDAVYLLGHLFLGGPEPAAPYPECGPGFLAADGVLGCLGPNNCP